MILFILLSLHSFFFACSEVKSDNQQETITETVESPVLVSEETPVAVVKETITPQEEVVVQEEVKVDLPEVKEELVQEDVVVVVEKKTTEKVTPEVINTTSVTTPEPIMETSPIKKPETIEDIQEAIVAGHADFDALLAKYVKNGRVNYAGFKSDGKFEDYLTYLSGNAPSTSDKSKAALAFWMNAYNAFTIKLITDNLPVKSIMDLDGGKPWDKKWIDLGGKTMSLNQIEHEIIRPVFNEPRIHFAVVCAANSCPPIASYAFTASNVDSKLSALTSAFINDPKFNQISDSKITLSPIFDWYGKDFGNVVGYIQKYAKSTVSDKAKVKFTSYDWGLNKQ